ncbi:Vacuolar protein sorting-associated protein 5 [Varicellaria rhodocarpa]|nr:Vacuolar protein sorting-associated protein 5 [Varicellaria rhodocarpa]
MLRQGKTQQDRLNQLQADVSDGERRCHQTRLLFEDMGRLMRVELERFENEKVEDFKSGVETFLEGAVEAQKELIELWETFLMQLDADEEDKPFFKPTAAQTEPILTKSQREAQQQKQSQPRLSAESEEAVDDPDGHGQVEAAATATVEQES